MRRLQLRIQAFRRMPTRSKRVFWLAVPLNLFFKVGLKAFGLKRCLALARRLGGSQATQLSEDSTIRAQEVVKGVVAAAGAAPTSVVCLPRSLTAWTILRRRGIPSEVIVGMHIVKQRDAHAWVVVDGEPVGERAEHLADFASFNEPLLPAT
jgi:hypothetical protein